MPPAVDPTTVEPRGPTRTANFSKLLGSDSGSAYVFERQVDGTWAETAKLTASDGASGDTFGISVALSGDRALVGADGGDDLGSDSGSAYVLGRQVDGTWAETAKLTASDGASGDIFGISVALSGDRALVGADGDDDLGVNSGSAYVFEQQAGAWAETAKLTASDGAFAEYYGVSVALTGERALVGAIYDDDLGDLSGSAYVYSLEGLLRLGIMGICPGSVTIRVRGATPGGRVPMIASRSLGTFTLPGGPCAGTDLDLANPRLLGVFIADGDGNISRTIQAQAVVCGANVQALDLGSCGTTNVEQVP